jgi:hypothetical protein
MDLKFVALHAPARFHEVGALRPIVPPPIQITFRIPVGHASMEITGRAEQYADFAVSVADWMRQNKETMILMGSVALVIGLIAAANRQPLH